MGWSRKVNGIHKIFYALLEISKNSSEWDYDKIKFKEYYMYINDFISS